MAYSCCFSLVRNLDFLHKKFYNIDCKNEMTYVRTYLPILPYLSIANDIQNNLLSIFSYNENFNYAKDPFSRTKVNEPSLCSFK